MAPVGSDGNERRAQVGTTSFVPAFPNNELASDCGRGSQLLITAFGRAKAACLCSYCCNRHLCYDGGGLRRVKIVTLKVGDSPYFLPSFRVST